MDYITKCAELKKYKFKSPEWLAAYTSLIKATYALDKIYVVLNPKKIDYDFEVAMPFITKMKLDGNDAVIALIFSDRVHADAWINKYGNGKNYIGELSQSMYNDFFAKCVLFKVNMCTMNEGNDSFVFGNADMVNFNKIPAQVKVSVPKELRGKDKVSLKDLHVDFNPIPINGSLAANEKIEKMQLMEHLDVNVGVLAKNDDVLINGKVHIFLTNQSVGDWMAKHKDIASEYNLKQNTVGQLAYEAITREGSKGLIVDGLAPFSLFADQNELSKIKSSLIAFTVFSQKSKGIITGAQAKEMLLDVEFFVCLDDNEKCGFDSMIREHEDRKFTAVQIYVTEENADKFNMREHEIVKMKLSDIVAKAQGYGLIFEPYSHYWIEIEPESQS